VLHCWVLKLSQAFTHDRAIEVGQADRDGPRGRAAAYACASAGVDCRGEYVGMSLEPWMVTGAVRYTVLAVRAAGW
jgi:hypothetical protein